MERINLMDVDFVIPVRIDSIVRLENLLAAIKYLTSHFQTNIYVLEAAAFNNQVLEKTLPSGVAYFFAEDFDPIFHRTKYINALKNKGIGKYVAIWDADVIIDFHQIIDAINLLRNAAADVAFPYDGHFYDTTEIVRSVYLETSDFSVLSSNIAKMYMLYGTNMNGGAVIIKRNKFEAAGAEDESFYGWGPEDWNRVEKWKKFDYTIKRADGPLFHLSHPRDQNGRLNSNWLTRYAFNTLQTTQRSSLEEIKGTIGTVKEVESFTDDKLHIGCGNCILPSWLNTDIHPCSEEVLHLDITKPFPFNANSFRFIFAEHVCEHISFSEFITTLQEIHRTLRPRGVFRIAMPSFDFLVGLYNTPQEAENSRYINWSIETFASAEERNAITDSYDKAIFTINKFMHSWGHQFVYSAHLIEHLLNATGFHNITRCQVGESSHSDLQNLEHHGTQIPQWANRLETVIFEAEK